jgi:multidrug efflux pump subunit AcrA (membrane-fusion protein)
MTEHTGRPWLNYLLGLLCVGAVVAAVLVVGPASGSQTAVTRTAKASLGVVQATVSGSGNLQPASQLNLGFKTGGTVTHIYVTQGEHVTEGRLLAELDPSSAEVTLEQARANLQAAQAKLAQEEETGGEPSKSQGSTSTPAAASAVATSSSTQSPTDASPEHAGEGSGEEDSENAGEGAGKRAAGTGEGAGKRAAGTGESKQAKPETQSPKSNPSNSSSSNTNSSDSDTSSPSSTATTLSTATREANLASARAAVKSDELTVKTDEEAVADTKLFAPQDGTIVTLSGQVGEVVSASGTTKASSDSGSSSSGSSGSGASATGGSSASARSGASSSSGSTGSSASSGSSSTAFAVLSDLSSMHLVVALSESEIGNVKVGQIATVTVEALSGRTPGGTSKLAAHVSEVATLSTSSSGVVSYDVTFQLDQMTDGLKPGMSATAEVVVKQAEGVSVPTSAISGGSVTVVRAGKDVRRPVVTGLAGNTSTIVLSGVKTGETVVLPAAVSTSSATSLTSRLSRLAGGGGGLSGGGLGGGGGGGAFFRGGG